jgi:tRNA pseudouridine55 synthase
LATGILPLAFGEATKLIPYVMDGDKAYEFTVRFGEERATDDAEGAVVAVSEARPDAASIQAALPAFLGEIWQTPPAFSAIKLDGERAYDLARAGEAVELAPRAVMVYDLRLVGMEGADSARFWVSCGKGMYVRSLARDLARALGTCGFVAALRRVKVGPFTIERAISLEKLEELSHKGDALTALLALRAALDDIPGLQLDASEAQCVRNGQSLLIRPQHRSLMDQPLVWAEHQGVPVAILTPEAGFLRVLRGFHF